jgi:hypothetical protein
MMNTMDTPMTRAEFERRFHLLGERLRNGKMFFADFKMTLGIQKVRYLPNGRIDFLSINESARLQANMMAQYENEPFKAMIRDRGEQEAPSGCAPGQPEEVPID